MEPRTLFGKVLTYVLLFIGCIAFVFPFVWMLSTSLKPSEQTNSIPPQWIPHNYHATLNGHYQQVIRANQPLLVPVLVVELEEGPEAGKKKIINVDDFKDGQARLAIAGEPHWFKSKLLRRAEPGWYYVKQRLETEDIDAPADWDFLPPEEIDSKAHLFWSNYPTAIRRMGMTQMWFPFVGTRDVPVFLLYLRNSLVVCGLAVAGTVISSALAAYSLAKVPWRGRNVLFGITLATMMIPFPVLMVPTYALFKNLGWVGTLLPLWVPPALGTGFNIFLLRQFFLTIPRDLSEAARIDGCSEFGIFWRIILPLSKPAIAVVALFQFLYSWNDFLGPLVYLTRQETFTLSLGLQAYQSQQGGVDWASLMAASTLVCVPIIILFFFTQRTFIKGIATTGIKG